MQYQQPKSLLRRLADRVLKALLPAPERQGAFGDGSTTRTETAATPWHLRQYPSTAQQLDGSPDGSFYRPWRSKEQARAHGYRIGTGPGIIRDSPEVVAARRAAEEQRLADKLAATAERWHNPNTEATGTGPIDATKEAVWSPGSGTRSAETASGPAADDALDPIVFGPPKVGSATFERSAAPEINFGL
jgi:hypothetical protein